MVEDPVFVQEAAHRFRRLVCSAAVDYDDVAFVAEFVDDFFCMGHETDDDRIVGFCDRAVEVDCEDKFHY